MAKLDPGHELAQVRGPGGARDGRSDLLHVQEALLQKILALTASPDPLAQFEAHRIALECIIDWRILPEIKAVLLAMPVPAPAPWGHGDDEASQQGAGVALHGIVEVHSPCAEADLDPHHRRPSTCFHESGHITACLALGGKIRVAEIGYKETRNDASSGRVSYNGWPPGGDLDSATVSAAGVVAQHLGGFPVDRESGRVDRARTRELLHPDAHLEPVITRRAEAILKANWAYVAALADLLLRRGRLTQTDVKIAMGGWRLIAPARAVPAAHDDIQLRLLSRIYSEGVAYTQALALETRVAQLRAACLGSPETRAKAAAAAAVRAGLHDSTGSETATD